MVKSASALQRALTAITDGASLSCQTFHTCDKALAAAEIWTRSEGRDETRPGEDGEQEGAVEEECMD